MTTGPAKVIYALVAVCALAASARASNYALEEIPQAIPAADAQRLKGQGIGTTFQLLEKAGEPKARKELAKAAKIPEKTLESWVQMADVMRVKGVGPDVTRLLASGQYKEIAEYCLRDVVATTELYTIWKQRLAGIR